MMTPDKLRPDISLQMFRNDIRAMWEDESNRNGGSFRISVQRGQVAMLWEKLLLGMIGEQLPADVTGVVVSNRQRGFSLAVWHATAENEIVRLEIANKLAETLGLGLKTRIDYSQFSNLMGGRMQPCRFITYVVESEGVDMVVTQKQRS